MPKKKKKKSKEKLKLKLKKFEKVLKAKRIKELD